MAKKNTLSRFMEDRAMSIRYTPKVHCAHIATEMKANGRDDGEDLCRQLLPHLKDRVLTLPRKA